jgi:hypothetical protein
MPAADSKLQRSWKQKLEDWRASGLNGAAWCRQEAIAYRVFHYWKKKFESNLSATQSPEKFIEIPEGTNEVGLVLECRDVLVHLTKGFDAELLQDCLQVLRRLRC